MPIMEWNDNLDVGHDMINCEHQEILDTMNRLFDLSKGGKTGPKIIGLLDQLEQVTIEHFAHEESFFDSINFPAAESHKTMHKMLLSRLSESSAIIRGRNGLIDDEFFEFLRDWLSAHIEGADTQYAEYSRSIGSTHAA